MRSTQAIVDLTALAWNLDVVRKRANGRKILGMVKANAYGHGIIEVSRELVRHGIDVLGVAFVDEGIHLREAGIEVPIMVLTPPEFSDMQDVLDYNLSSVICDIEHAQALSAAAVSSQKRASVHVYVDTGMRRDGVRSENATAFVNQLSACPNLAIDGICTHLATSDEQDHSFIEEQLTLFREVLRKLSDQGHTFAMVHAANTGAIWQCDEALFTMVRPGLSLYGYASPKNDLFQLRPVMSIISRVLSLRPVHAGETVSYGRRWMATQDTHIATIPIGYGDGYARELTGKTWCLIRGQQFPVVGTICMDECMVDVGNSGVEVGDEVVLLGRQADVFGNVRSIDAVDLAAWSNTIPYEITTSISARVPRVFEERR